MSAPDEDDSRESSKTKYESANSFTTRDESLGPLWTESYECGKKANGIPSPPVLSVPSVAPALETSVLLEELARFLEEEELRRSELL